MAMIQLEIVFDALSVSRVRMFVKETNSSALKFNGRLGYREDGHEEGFLWLTMTASEYSSVKPQLLRYFRNNT